MTDLEMILPKTDEELKKEIKRVKFNEYQNKYRERNREKYNEYMKNLTNKLYEDEEYKKNRMEQMKIIANKHRLLKNAASPSTRGRGRPPKNINIATC
jgi:uncharacterized HAD superfamily protein